MSPKKIGRRRASLEAYENCALVPAYNEAKNIKKVVGRIKKAGMLPIVIDDCSTDSTFEVAKKANAIAIVIRHDCNVGKGEAIKTGISYVLKNLPRVRNLVFIDADMQYDPKEAPRLIKSMEREGAEVALGFRDWSVVPYRHRLGNFVWRTFFNMLFGTNLKDTNCGLMAVNRRVAKQLTSVLWGGYIIENSILAHIAEEKIKIAETPVNVKYKDKSTVARGIRMVLGIWVFILLSGLKYRLGPKGPKGRPKR